MAVRGIRGATTSTENTSEAIQAATKDLLIAILDQNPELSTVDIGSVIFTVSEDLTAEYPAHAARELGWNEVPLLCAREIPVTKSLTRCIRVLIHWNTDLVQSEIQHVYLGEASILRPDIRRDRSISVKK